jgi:hypothetical protein
MSSSSSSTLPLVRAIALLPDDRFFTTTVALADGQEAGSVAAQVELALEAVSPFPVAQLYQGHFTRPGAKRALAFAAYRKRFAAEETALWTAAELVTPAFAVLLGAPPAAGATTWVLSREDGLTALHFDDDSGVPAAVRVGSWTPEATADERGAVREAVLREFPGSRAVVELPAPVAGPAAGESFIFQSGDVHVEFSEDAAAALDVRDKTELAALALARTRDRWLWRSLVGLAALIGLCAFTEVALLGAGAGGGRNHDQAVAGDADRGTGVEAPAADGDDLAGERLASALDPIHEHDDERPLHSGDPGPDGGAGRY